MDMTTVVDVIYSKGDVCCTLSVFPGPRLGHQTRMPESQESAKGTQESGVRHTSVAQRHGGRQRGDRRILHYMGLDVKWTCHGTNNNYIGVEEA